MSTNAFKVKLFITALHKLSLATDEERAWANVILLMADRFKDEL